MYTFKKEERLCSKKLLDMLFNNGSSFLIYPFRVVHLPENAVAEYPAQVVIVVPKRRYKRAHDRNLIKRRVREAYRLNKGEFFYPFLKQADLTILLSLQYVGKEIADYPTIEKKLKAVFRQLNKIYVENDSQDSKKMP